MKHWCFFLAKHCMSYEKFFVKIQIKLSNERVLVHLRNIYLAIACFSPVISINYIKNTLVHAPNRLAYLFPWTYLPDALLRLSYSENSLFIFTYIRFLVLNISADMIVWLCYFLVNLDVYIYIYIYIIYK